MVQMSSVLESFFLENNPLKCVDIFYLANLFNCDNLFNSIPQIFTEWFQAPGMGWGEGRWQRLGIHVQVSRNLKHPKAQYTTMCSRAFLCKHPYFKRPCISGLVFSALRIEMRSERASLLSQKHALREQAHPAPQNRHASSFAGCLLYGKINRASVALSFKTKMSSAVLGDNIRRRLKMKIK